MKKNKVRVSFLKTIPQYAFIVESAPVFDMIQMTHVYKTYPNQISALSDITLEISPGEFTFIAGPSGSGKTTLLRILFCAEKPTSGEVIVNGIPITSTGFRRFIN